MLKIILIGLGGFLGAISRYLIYVWLEKPYVVDFPLPTFIVNITGSFVLGAIYALALRQGFISENLLLFLTVGFCGSFTTFSTFSYENLQLLRQENYLIFTSYTLLSVFLSILAAFLGYFMFKSG